MMEPLVLMQRQGLKRRGIEIKKDMCIGIGVDLDNSEPTVIPWVLNKKICLFSEILPISHVSMRL